MAQKIALITGTSSGIGETLALRLIEMGFYVIGVSRHINETLQEKSSFEFIKCDLSSEKETLQLCEKIKKIPLHILINNAGFGRFAPHEELSTKTILEMSFVNLTAPMLITNATLKELKKNDGYLININSIEAFKTSKFSALYSATKTGLKAFGDVLFEETRKSGLSVTNINPDMTSSNFYDELRFETSTKEDEHLFTQDIADAVQHILTMRKGAVVSEYTIRSLKFGIAKKTH
jgi:hypothetical protein